MDPSAATADLAAFLRSAKRLERQLFFIQLVVGLLIMSMLGLGLSLLVAVSVESHEGIKKVSTGDRWWSGIALMVVALVFHTGGSWMMARVATANLRWVLSRLGHGSSTREATALPPALLEMVERLCKARASLLPERIGLLGRILLHELNDKVTVLGLAMLPFRDRPEKDAQTVLGAFDEFLSHLTALRTWLKLRPQSGAAEREKLALVDLARVIAKGSENWDRKYLTTRATVPGAVRVRGLNKLLEGVVDNLVNNAIRHNGEAAARGELKVRVFLTVGGRLPAGVAREEAYGPPPPRAVVRVWDNGGWLAPEIRDGLFIPRDDDPEHGIGLAVSRAVIQSLGGDLFYWDPAQGPWIDPKPTDTQQVEDGARRWKAFWFYLPVVGGPPDDREMEARS